MGIHPARIIATMAKRGMLAPALPHRQFAQLHALRVWGVGVAGELRQSAGRSPRSIAVVDEERGDVSFAELLDGANRVTAWLGSVGEDADGAVGLLARNHVGLIECIVGVNQLGADVVLGNTGLGAEQLAAVVAEQGLTRLIHDDEFAPLVAEARLDVPTTSESELRAALSSLGAVPNPSPPARAGRTIILTSGTTGAPKGAARRTPGGLSPLVSIIDRIPLQAGERILISAPLFHTWGYAALQLALGLHSTVVLQRRFDPARVRAALESDEVDVLFAVPVMLQRVMELPETPRARRTARLRVVATSGSAYPSGFTTRFMDAYGDVLYNLYGSTEASWISIATPSDLRRHPDTAGTPPLGTRAEILDDALRPVGPGDTGRIFVGNEMVFEGYTNGDNKQFHEGMVSTGDLGHVDDDLWFVDGREDDMVISGGENVFPSSVEAVLVQVDGVREVSVVGVPDPDYGQRLVAFLCLDEGASLTDQEVKDLVRAKVARHAVPREVHFLDELPRNATGKVLARELRSRIP